MNAQFHKDTLFLGKWGDESAVEIKCRDAGCFVRETKRGLEFDIALEHRPRKNTFAYDVRGENLAFYFQPPLSEADKARGCVRPDDVVGSFAAYHPTKRGYNLDHGPNYEAGKVFHIFRPKAIDKNGEESWAKLSFRGGKMVVAVDPAFLKKAAYPVIVDPEFGYHPTTPASHSTLGSDAIYGARYTATGDGTATSIAWYLAHANASGPYNFSLGLYDASTPQNRKANTAESSLTDTPEWKVKAVTVGGSFSAGNHWICFNSVDNVNYYYDTGPGSYCYYVAQTEGTWPATITMADAGGTDNYAAYVVYTAAGGADVTRPLTGVSG